MWRSTDQRLPNWPAVEKATELRAFALGEGSLKPSILQLVDLGKDDRIGKTVYQRGRLGAALLGGVFLLFRTCPEETKQYKTQYEEECEAYEENSKDTLNVHGRTSR